MTSYFNPSQTPAFAGTPGLTGGAPNLLAYPAAGLNQQAYPNMQPTQVTQHPVVDARSTVRQLTAMIPEWKGHFDLADAMLAVQETTLNNINVMVAQLYAFYEQFQNTLEFSKSSLSDINLQQEKLNNEMAERLKSQDMQNLVTIKSRRLCEIIIGNRESTEPGGAFRVPNHINVQLSKELFERVRNVKNEVDFIQNEVQLLKEIDVFKAPAFIETVLFSHESRLAALSDSLANMLNRAEATLHRDLKRELWNSLTNQTTNLRRNFMEAVGLETPKPYDLDATPMTEVKRQIRYLKNFNASYNDPNFPYLRDYGYNIKDLLVNTVPNPNLFMPGPTLGTGNLFAPAAPATTYGQTPSFGAAQPQQQFATGLGGTQSTPFGTTPAFGTAPAGTTGLGTTGLGGTGFGATGQATSPFGTSSGLGATTGLATTSPFGGSGLTTGASSGLSSGLGTGPFGTTAAPSTTTNIFAPSSTTTQPPTNLFGQQTTTQQPTGLFGQQQQTQPATGLGGAFGSGAGSFTTGSNVFASQQTQQSTNLFGQSQAPATTTTAFGTPGSTGAGLFGASATPTTSTGLFGQTQQVQPTTTFGSTATGTGSTVFGTAFGSSSTASTTPFGGSGFGVTGSTIGTSQPSAGPFGQQTTQTSTNLFGQPQQTQQPSVLFGNTATGTGPFGSTATSPFGTSSGGIFGTSQPKSTGTELALYTPTTSAFGTFGRT